MEFYWCTEKNDIRNLMKIPIALTPCLKADCDRYRDGECIHIRKAGKSAYSRLVGELRKGKKRLLFPGSLDEQHGSQEPDDHGGWQEN